MLAAPEQEIAPLRKERGERVCGLPIPLTCLLRYVYFQSQQFECSGRRTGYHRKKKKKKNLSNEEKDAHLAAEVDLPLARRMPIPSLTERGLSNMMSPISVRNLAQSRDLQRTAKCKHAQLPRILDSEPRLRSACKMQRKRIYRVQASDILVTRLPCPRGCAWESRSFLFKEKAIIS